MSIEKILARVRSYHSNAMLSLTSAFFILTIMVIILLVWNFISEGLDNEIKLC